jgi:hypothetical protein
LNSIIISVQNVHDVVSVPFSNNMGEEFLYVSFL